MAPHTETGEVETRAHHQRARQPRHTTLQSFRAPPGLCGCVVHAQITSPPVSRSALYGRRRSAPNAHHGATEGTENGENRQVAKNAKEKTKRGREGEIERVTTVEANGVIGIGVPGWHNRQTSLSLSISESHGLLSPLAHSPTLSLSALGDLGALAVISFYFAGCEVGNRWSSVFRHSVVDSLILGMIRGCENAERGLRSAVIAFVLP